MQQGGSMAPDSKAVRTYGTRAERKDWARARRRTADRQVRDPATWHHLIEEPRKGGPEGKDTGRGF